MLWGGEVCVTKKAHFSILLGKKESDNAVFTAREETLDERVND